MPLQDCCTANGNACSRLVLRLARQCTGGDVANVLHCLAFRPCALTSMAQTYADQPAWVVTRSVQHAVVATYTAHASSLPKHLLCGRALASATLLGATLHAGVVERLLWVLGLLGPGLALLPAAKQLSISCLHI